jgi:hypothetical protein
MYQDSKYDGGILQYSDTGKPNIEFEAKLLQDLVCAIGLGGCAYLGAGSIGSALNSDYDYWINNLTDYGDSIPTYEQIMNYEYNNHGYWDFMESFKSSIPNYDKQIDYDVSPVVLSEIY